MYGRNREVRTRTHGTVTLKMILVLFFICSYNCFIDEEILPRIWNFVTFTGLSTENVKIATNSGVGSKSGERTTTTTEARTTFSQVSRRLIERFQDHYLHLTRAKRERTGPNLYHEQPIESGKDVVVHLFEWRWDDVANECETFLGPKGFAAIQISPPNEHSVLVEPSWGRQVRRPWYERYRPVSYLLKTRSGDEQDFARMLRRCNTAGLRVYADVVINHMSFHLDEEVSTAGSPFNSRAQSYPAVPYNQQHFNSREKCGSRSGDIEDFQNVFQLRNCRLLGLNDLNQRHPHVVDTIVSYLNHLISLGAAGFRVDAAKHMWPSDLDSIFSRLDFLNDSYFPPGTRPFVYQEVTDMGLDPVSAAEYTAMGRVTEFKYGLQLAPIFLPTSDGTRPRLSELKDLSSGPGFLHSRNAFVFVDNHDTQRGHGAGEGNRILTFRDGHSYVLAVAFMLAWPYGVPCLMSSYWWDQDIQSVRDKNDWVGPPHDSQWNIRPVEVDDQGSCVGGWICEHRWPAIAAMVSFRNAVRGSIVSHWWDNGGDQVAFARLNRGFVAFNGGSKDMEVLLQTGLPAGQYCNVLIQTCVQPLVVDEDGQALVRVPAGQDLPAAAYYVTV